MLSNTQGKMSFPPSLNCVPGRGGMLTPICSSNITNILSHTTVKSNALEEYNSFTTQHVNFHSCSLKEEKLSLAANLTQSSLQLDRDIKQIRNKLVNDKRIRRIDFADQLKAVSSQCAQFDRVEQLLSKDKKKMKSSQKIEKLESEVLHVQNRYHSSQRLNNYLFYFYSVSYSIFYKTKYDLHIILMTSTVI